MSSPLSNLKRGRKTPLVAGSTSRNRIPPFRQGLHKDEDQVRHHADAPKSARHSNGRAPNDKELLSVVMARLTNAEKQLKEANLTIKEKDKRIRVLEEKCTLMQKARGHDDDRVAELESLCQTLQSQVLEMENFLEDYGMIWVGNTVAGKGTEVKATVNEGDDDTQASSGMVTNRSGVWQPESSLPSYTNKDFDQIVKNVEELNVLAGEGEHVVRHTTEGARLEVKEAVPLTLFANGLVLFSGPFRPYSDPETQQCMQDLLDGYFPGELQERYPDGVPLHITDKRAIHFRDKRQERLFPGSGHTLTEAAKSDSVKNPMQENIEIQASGSEPKPVHTNETSEIPGAQPQTLDQFLKKLPPSVVQKGRMVEVRSDIENLLKDSLEKSEVRVIETQTAKELRLRSGAEDDKKGLQNGITTLRIKSENGENTYMLKMKSDETIEDLRRYIDSNRPDDARPYQIKTTFPNKTYDIESMTLKECGLVPNATLHLTERK